MMEGLRKAVGKLFTCLVIGGAVLLIVSLLLGGLLWWRW